MKFRMTNKNVLVEPITENISEGGIVLRTDFEPKTMKGKILAFDSHPECSEELSEGDIVFYHKFAGKPLKLENKTYRVINIIDILAKE